MTIRKIIVGYEGGERSHDALRLGALFARATGAELIVAHAYHDGRVFHAGGEDRLLRRAAATERLAQAEALLPYAMRATLQALEARSPVQALHDLAAREEADLIVVGTTGRGALELHAVGSVPERLLHGAPCAVAVAPRGFAREAEVGLHVIGVAVDGSRESEDAAAAAAELAQQAHSAMKVIGVVEPVPPPVAGPTAMYAAASEGNFRDAVHAELEEVADSLPPELRPEIVLADGDAAEELIERAAPLSLLVMGSRGYGPFRRALLGSVSAPVLRAAPCPVLVVPRGAALGLHVPAAQVSAS